MSSVQDLVLRVGGDGEEASSMLDGLGTDLTGLINPAGLVVAGILAIGTALVGLGVYGVLAADDIKKAMNTLQTQTGATDKEMAGLEDSLLSIYSQNYGENYMDIAESMALVKQSSKTLGVQTVADLEKMTKGALVLKDTFGFELESTIDTTSTLMNSFGLSGEQAYNLIAQGAQKGMNRNGDMLEILNEYSPQFKALGFTGEQFFDTIITGAQDGTWSIDRIGDAVKEFTIRSKDGSKATQEAFTDLGFNAEEMTKTFAKGGKEANDAFYEVNERLLAMKDPVKQNALGVVLWGTMYEDLEKKGIASIINIDKHVSKNTQTLKEIDSIKYDSFGEALAGIKRQFDVNIAVPIGKVILPILSKMVGIFSVVAAAIRENLAPMLGIMKTKIIEAFGGSLPDIDSFVAMIVDNIPAAFEMISSVVLPVLDNMLQFIKNIGAAGQGEFKTGFIDTIKNEIPIIVEEIKKVAIEFMKFWDAIVAFSQTPAFKEIINSLLRFVAVATSVTGTIIKWVLKMSATFYKVFTSVINLITWVDNKFTTSKIIIVQVMQAMGNQIKSIWNSIISKVKSVNSTMKSVLISLVNWLKSAIPSAFRAAVDLAKAAWNRLPAGIRAAASSARSAAASVINAVKNVISGLSLYSSGQKIIRSLINGIKSLAGSAWNAVTDLVQGIRNKLPFSPAKEGPLKDLDKTGPGFISTIIKGLRKSSPKLKAIMWSIAEKMNLNTKVLGQQVTNVAGSGASNIIVNINEPHIYNDRDIDVIGTKLVSKLQSNNIHPERR